MRETGGLLNEQYPSQTGMHQAGADSIDRSGMLHEHAAVIDERHLQGKPSNTRNQFRDT